MATITITLNPDRNYCGILTVDDDDGRTIRGPFPVCGRAGDRAAAAHRNAGRLPVLRFGDTPLGTFRVARILASGAGTSLSAEQFGPHGVIVLDAVSGDAALAEANGRFHIFIQGGAGGPAMRLRTTNGALRLADKDQQALVEAVQPGMICRCLDNSLQRAGLAYLDDSYDQGEPPAVLDQHGGLAHRGVQFSRRDMIKAGAAAAVGVMDDEHWRYGLCP